MSNFLNDTKRTAQVIQSEFEEIFEREADRFINWKKLIKRFEDAFSALRNDPVSYGQIDEIHNEMCVAYVLLTLQNLKLDEVLYEPQIPGAAKTIDFRYSIDGRLGYVDVKTIRTKQAHDSWSKFEEARENRYFLDSCTFILDEDYGGGQIWHDFVASRSKMIEYTRELEAKTEYLNDSVREIPVWLVFCGNGFHWNCLDLKNFVDYYWSGKNAMLDPFPKMQEHYIETKAIQFSRLINCFGCMKRGGWSMYPDEMKWISLKYGV